MPQYLSKKIAEKKRKKTIPKPKAAISRTIKKKPVKKSAKVRTPKAVGMTANKKKIAKKLQASLDRSFKKRGATRKKSTKPTRAAGYSSKKDYLKRLEKTANPSLYKRKKKKT